MRSEAKREIANLSRRLLLEELKVSNVISDAISIRKTILRQSSLFSQINGSFPRVKRYRNPNSAKFYNAFFIWRLCVCVWHFCNTVNAVNAEVPYFWSKTNNNSENNEFFQIVTQFLFYVYLLFTLQIIWRISIYCIRNTLLLRVFNNVCIIVYMSIFVDKSEFWKIIDIYIVLHISIL